MLFLDIETQNEIFGKDFSSRQMRISFVGAIDYSTGDEFGFWESDLDQLKTLMFDSDYIVGYNLFSFDMPIIAGYLGDKIMDLPQIDLMVAAQKEIGFRPSLNDLALATLEEKKAGSGLDAIRYFKQKKFQKLKEYCMVDVRLTVQLYEYGLENGYIRYYDRDRFRKEVSIDWDNGKIENLQPTDIIKMF